MIERYGITVTDRSSPVGLSMGDLTRIALRRNPKRVQLLVSTVLGKHLPVDPRVAAGAGRLLGALVARCLADDRSPVSAAWRDAAAATLRGVDPGRLLDRLPPVSPVAANVLTVGFAETATSLGHLVADQLGSAYLHSTRRPDGDVPVTAEFVEPHSHATGHLLRPAPAVPLAGTGPLVLVDDELSTGRTALNVIEAVHAAHPRSRYVLAGLVDVRSAEADATRARVAARLGCRIDVVSLVGGAVEVPDGTAHRVARELPDGGPAAPMPGAPAGAPPVRELTLPWPASVPHGGRHGFATADRPAFDEAIAVAAAALDRACGDARRVLVLGTEELMYLPLRLALALQAGGRPAGRAAGFQSTTRSPVHALQLPGYPIRRRIDFTGLVHPAGGERAVRHVYNVRWPAELGSVGPDEADLVVVVDDGHALDHPDGVVARIAGATGTPVLLARLPDTGLAKVGR